MRLVHAVLKRSLGKLSLHALARTYRVDVNEAAVLAIEDTLAGRSERGRALVDRLAVHGVVDVGPFAPIPRREGSDLVSIEIEPIGACNLRCRHCFVDFSGERMSAATFLAVLEGARALGAVEITFNGGEALLHPRAVEWIEEVRASGFRARLFTNATLVDRGVARRLGKAGLARATVSLDGFEREHDALRGAGAFARASAGIRALVEEGISVHTTTLVHPENETRVAALQRFAREELGVAAVRTSTIAPLGRASAAPDLILAPPRLRAVYAGVPPPKRGRAPGLLPCSAGVEKLYVAAGGRVHACHLFDRPESVIGRLPEEPLVEIHARARRMPLLGRFDEGQLDACASCPALAECRGGCRARAWTMTGDPYGRDPIECAKRGLEGR